MPSLAEIRKGWDQAARQDAMFNILTEPGCDGGRWDPDEFFGRGIDEVEQLRAHLDRLGLADTGRRAMDFGCGVGRLTQALARHYTFVDGVDVSVEMVARARGWAQQLGHSGACRFYVNRTAGLGDFSDCSFDLVYSVITLQHMPQRLQRGYVKEFVRLLAKGGVAVFQIPEGSGDYIHPQSWLSMYPASRETVVGWLADTDGRLVDVDVSEHGGAGWTGWRYTVARA